MSGSDPKIEFPCDNYPIKVIGENDGQIISAVINIFTRHVPNFTGLAAFTIRPSTKGNFQSLNTRITAQSQRQLELLNADLQRCKGVRLVL